MNLLTPVWQEVKQLLQQGISVIPVRDKDEASTDGGIRLKKTPYAKWKQFQHRIVEEQELYAAMEQHDTTAIAMLTGKISGNMEVIDIDVKWLPGVDARLFNDLKTLYPDLLQRLRIHKSPSGGYHLIYRVQDFVVPGNQKLASRQSTEKELLEAKAKIKCFIETRGEGGYILAPPSLGYTVHHEAPLPTITETERESLISLCRCYNQVVKPDQQTTSTKEDAYYDINPFEHFNQSPAAETVLKDAGWKFAGRSGDYLHFTRPDKDKGISASFIISKRVYYIFTTNSEFENDRGYKPASILALIKFNGDKKLLYGYLIQQGYGKIKPEVELRLAKTKSIQGKPLPSNASEDAIKFHAELVTQLDALHPYGIFWQLTEENGVFIDREGLYRVASGLGFRHWRQEVVQIEGYFIHKRTERYFFDTLKEYIKEEDANFYKDICNTFEGFLQRAGKFTIERIELLDESLLIRDTKQTCYKFYQNGYLFITNEKYTLNEYKNLAGLIWAEQVQPRMFQPAEPGGRYLEYLKKATPYDELTEHIQGVLGYLAHDFKDETTAYIIVQTEQCSDPRQGGGTGKNLFINLLNYTTTTKTIPGSQIRHDEKFMQAWNGERVFHVSDVSKKFDYEFLKELSSGSAILKKLFKDEVTIEPGDMCKFVISTQFSYEVTDGGLKRRLIPLEFTNFFTQAGGVDVHFGCHFPNDWTTEDWQGYDNLIAWSVKAWLESGLKLHNQVLSSGGWLKQFEQSYMSSTREFIEQNWDDWKDNFIATKDFNESYETFIKENNIHKNYSLTAQRMNKALSEWCEKHNYTFNANVQKSVNGLKFKGREFLPFPPF